MDTVLSFLFGQDVHSGDAGLPYPYTHTIAYTHTVAPSASASLRFHSHRTAHPSSTFATALQEAHTVATTILPDELLKSTVAGSDMNQSSLHSSGPPLYIAAETRRPQNALRDNPDALPFGSLEGYGVVWVSRLALDVNPTGKRLSHESNSRRCGS
ncbi:hypothetical protein B0H19DRAFT_1258447 [Mycena capillaripes]|nr:hypothetical protein B0H19DRAFT_1258447 [Mycena capillaripes]